LARIFWGIKGTSWYWSQPLLHAKLTLVLAMLLLSIAPTLAFRRWRRALRANGSLPGAVQVRNTRRLIMVQSHILPVVAVLAVFLARGG
jgi:putative membrane protein